MTSATDRQRPPGAMIGSLSLDTAAGGQNGPDDRPLVSIIMPCFNNEAYVAEAIESALGQSYPNIEVIVIDDGSTDRSLDIIRSYEGRIVWRTGPNEGACAARNKGLALARGAFIKFLDADDVLERDCTRTQLHHYRECSNENEIVVGSHARIDAVGRCLPGLQYVHNLGAGETISFSQLLLHAPLTTEPLHRANLLRRIGGFNPGVHRGQEHEMHLRAFARGAIFKFFPALCYYYRIHLAEDRISVKVPHKHHFAAPESYLALWKDLTRRFETIPAELEAALAQDAWRNGRLLLRAGDTERATKLFRVACSLYPDNPRFGSAAYRWLCAATGPQVAERVGQLNYHLRRSMWRSQQGDSEA